MYVSAPKYGADLPREFSVVEAMYNLALRQVNTAYAILKGYYDDLNPSESAGEFKFNEGGPRP